MTVNQTQEFGFPVSLWPSEKLAEYYEQPENAHFPTPWTGDSCFAFDKNGRVVIFDYIFDKNVNDKREKWKKIDDRDYYLQSRSPGWIDRKSGYAGDNAGFIIYPMYEWINALMKESHMCYVSSVLRTLVKNDIIHSYTI